MTSPPPYPPPPAPAPPRKSRRTLWIVLGSVGGALVMCCAALVVIGVIVGPPKKTASTGAAAPASGTAEPPTASPSPTTAAPTQVAVLPDLTGLGATLDQWNAHHVRDTDFPQGSAYDPDPSVQPVGGHVGPRYIEVVIAGHVIAFQRNFANGGVPQSTALAEVRADLPSDAVVKWQQGKDGNCMQVEYASATLANVLDDPQNPQGMVFVEMHTLREGGIYNPGKVWYALVNARAYLTPGDALGC